MIEEMLTIRPHRRPSCGARIIWSKQPATAVEMNERLDVGIVHGGQQAFVVNPGVLAQCFDEGWYCVDLRSNGLNLSRYCPTPHTEWRSSRTAAPR
jgi:hypothetical protein